jgi:acid phosphatase type 7
VHTLTAGVRDAEGLAAVASLEVEATAGGHVVLAAGDIASCNSGGDEATAALLDRRFGTVLTLGDNAYPDGSLAHYESCYAPSWGRHRARTRPVAGNHEYRTQGAAGHFAYFGAAAGEAAMGWYSFDLGSWRVVMLNSNCDEIGGCARSSPQGHWLAADLVANPRECTLAVWHHPRFSSGSKHGGGANRSPLRRLLPEGDATSDLYAIFHEHGGDLILSGHDHNYERFAPQDALGNGHANAPRQFVVGTGGATPRPMGEIQPNSEASAGHVHGVLALTLHAASYDWEFVSAAGFGYTDAGSAPCAVRGLAASHGPYPRAEASTLCDAVLDAVGVELTAALALAVLLQRFRRSRIRATA